MWIASLEFEVSKERATTKNDDNLVVMVDALATGLENKVDALQAKRLFIGDQTPIVSRRSYSLEFQCNFDLVMYPFDSQMCPIIVKVPSYLAEIARVKMVARIHAWSRDMGSEITEAS